MQTKKCCCSCKVERGAFVFAIISSIIMGFASLLGLGITLYSIFVHVWSVVHSNSTFFGPFAPFTMIILTTLAGIAFAFTVILCKGVHKRKAEYVKLYFVYGVVVAVLCLAASIGMSMFYLEDNGEPFFRVSSIVLFCISVFYSLVLLMIRATYKKFELESGIYNQFGHKLLDEKF